MNNSSQTITLTENQLEAVARHLEHIAESIRVRISSYPEHPVLIDDMQVVETALESTETLARAINRPSVLTDDELALGLERRTGRRRRSRRR